MGGTPASPFPPPSSDGLLANLILDSAGRKGDFLVVLSLPPSFTLWGRRNEGDPGCPLLTKPTRGREVGVPSLEGGIGDRYRAEIDL